MRDLSGLVGVAVVAMLAGCGNAESTSQDSSYRLPTIAETSDIRFDSAEKGVTPFIYNLNLVGRRLPAIKTISYVIEPKPGSVSKPVHVTYSLQALKNRGDLVTSELLHLPVFGLYEGYTNAVSISIGFADASTQVLSITVPTDAYVDPNGIYDRPVTIKARQPGSSLGFDFFAMKSNLGTPVISDTDGNVRWIGAGVPTGFAATFKDNQFIIGSRTSASFYRLDLDGSFESIPIASSKYLDFHHNIDFGKAGFLGEFDTASDIESIIAEFDLSGAVLKEWDFGAILTNFMAAGGDDPTKFVRPGVDWFHSNALTYDPRDDSLIASSRENFIMKVDYQTNRIIWVFGDPTKYWYSFPSLRAKALALDGASLNPIGQHALSITSDGLLMMFNNGYQSVNQPAGAPAGSRRGYSAISAYRIDEINKTATEEWRFDYDQSISSIVCGSAYEAADKSVLVNYAYADSGTHVRVVGLDGSHQVAFDLQYDNASGCNSSWNAVPIPLDDMRFQ